MFSNFVINKNSSSLIPLTGIRLSELSNMISTYADSTRCPVPS